MTTLCPSGDLLCDIFLKDFEDRKTFYEEAMRLTTCSDWFNGGSHIQGMILIFENSVNELTAYEDCELTLFHRALYSPPLRIG